MKNQLAQYGRLEVADNFFIWYDGDELVATLRIREQWVCNLFVSPRYRKQGLSYDLLDIATIFGGSKLYVRKTNQIALHTYQKYGFKIFDEDDEFIFMKLIEDKADKTAPQAEDRRRYGIHRNTKT